LAACFSFLSLIVGDVERLDIGVLVVPASNSMLPETHFGPDLQVQNCGSQISQAHQIVGRACQSEDPVHLADSAMPHFAHQGNRF
jgi:hypothetical protein